MDIREKTLIVETFDIYANGTCVMSIIKSSFAIRAIYFYGGFAGIIACDSAVLVVQIEIASEKRVLSGEFFEPR